MLTSEPTSGLTNTIKNIRTMAAWMLPRHLSPSPELASEAPPTENGKPGERCRRIFLVCRNCFFRSGMCTMEHFGGSPEAVIRRPEAEAKTAAELPCAGE